MNSLGFYEFLVISVISLGITFVLFRFLNAYARGKAKILGGSILYGGSLGGYILVFLVLFNGYSSMVLRMERTQIDINGRWNIDLVKRDGSHRSGNAIIHQRDGSQRFQMLGETESLTTPPSISFSSLVGICKERRIVFLYENNRREMGIASGNIQENQPSSFTVFYWDVSSSDTNQDLQGRMTFSRKTKD